MLSIISLATINTFRKFTLTSGYNNTNTMFVRVKDGYSVGADPIPVKKDGVVTTHHIKYEGYLYACRKGYVMATLKGGYQGWSDIVEVTTNTYKVFNPFEGRTLELRLDGQILTIEDGKGKTATNIGKFATVFGEVAVIASPFKGLRNFMRLIRLLPEWATIHVNNVSYNESMTLKYDMGTVITGQFDLLESFNLHTVEYCVVDEGNTLIKTENRYFSFQNFDYHNDNQVLRSQNILVLSQASSHYENTAEIPCNSEYETTQKWWDYYTDGKEIATGKVLLVYIPEEIRKLVEVEMLLLNNVGEKNLLDYINRQYVKESLHLGEATNGGMTDERQYVCRCSSNNIKAAYFALITSNSSQMLCNLIHMPYKLANFAWEFEKDRLLGSFLSFHMENKKDMQQLWLSAISLTPEPMENWLNKYL